jgi:hypothetical protein
MLPCSFMVTAARRTAALLQHGVDERHRDMAVSSLRPLAYQPRGIPPAWNSMLAEYHKPSWNTATLEFHATVLLTVMLTVMLVCADGQGYIHAAGFK